MKQLTRNEVVELIAKAMFNDWQKILIKHSPELADIVWGGSKENWFQQSETILQALEDNRILCLVEGESKYGDLILTAEQECAFEIVGGELEEGGIILTRNSIPAYHCKPETKKDNQ